MDGWDLGGGRGTAAGRVGLSGPGGLGCSARSCPCHPEPSLTLVPLRTRCRAASEAMVRVVRGKDVPEMSRLRRAVVYLVETALCILLNGGFAFTGDFGTDAFLWGMASRAMQTVTVLDGEQQGGRKYVLSRLHALCRTRSCALGVGTRAFGRAEADPFLVRVWNEVCLRTYSGPVERISRSNRNDVVGVLVVAIKTSLAECQTQVFREVARCAVGTLHEATGGTEDYCKDGTRRLLSHAWPRRTAVDAVDEEDAQDEDATEDAMEEVPLQTAADDDNAVASAAPAPAATAPVPSAASAASAADASAAGESATTPTTATTATGADAPAPATEAKPAAVAAKQQGERIPYPLPAGVEAALVEAVNQLVADAAAKAEKAARAEAAADAARYVEVARLVTERQQAEHAISGRIFRAVAPAPAGDIPQLVAPSAPATPTPARAPAPAPSASTYVAREGEEGEREGGRGRGRAGEGEGGRAREGEGGREGGRGRGRAWKGEGGRGREGESEREGGRGRVREGAHRRLRVCLVGSQPRSGSRRAPSPRSSS